ncbi:hypothetical protein NPIL_370821 [Nephila pilipes]|uniref:Uncharacterized protein n=1 Tax=Nephila pilipes TaxID=299642 RepID=A0A8X6PRU3_NEPPI|nr:hypothetical protein NPIL_370821 [Nephila pilipes]
MIHIHLFALFYFRSRPTTLIRNINVRGEVYAPRKTTHFEAKIQKKMAKGLEVAKPRRKTAGVINKAQGVNRFPFVDEQLFIAELRDPIYCTLIRQGKASAVAY